MSNLVEITGHSEALEAEWFCTLLDKEVSSLSIRDCLGVAGDVIDMGQIIFGKYRIVVFYDKSKYGLHQLCSSDFKLSEYIQKNLRSAFKDAIVPYKDGIFLLNIASTENLGAFDWKHAKDILDKQLQIFMPIIHKFMVDALTDSLMIEEEAQ